MVKQNSWQSHRIRCCLGKFKDTRPQGEGSWNSSWREEQTSKSSHPKYRQQMTEHQTAGIVFWTCFYSQALPQFFVCSFFNWKSPENLDHSLVLSLKPLCRSTYNTSGSGKSQLRTGEVCLCHQRPARRRWRRPGCCRVAAITQAGSVFSRVGKHSSRWCLDFL